MANAELEKLAIIQDDLLNLSEVCKVGDKMAAC